MRQRAGRILWAVYLFLWAWSVPLLAFDLVPAGGELMASVMLILPGGLCGWWLIERFKSAGAAAAAVILLGSWATEHIGVTTGWPFGMYRYNGVLQPEIGGVVPLAIPFAWLLVVPGALEIARLGLGHVRPLAQISLAAALAMLFDMVIEPAAVYLNGYWTWLERGPIFGIPTSNFIAWLGLALLLATITRLLIEFSRWRGRIPADISLPAMLYVLNLSLFTLVDLTHGQLGAGLLGLVLLVGGVALGLRRRVRWQLRYDALR
jgi:putative membrane protein